MVINQVQGGQIISMLNKYADWIDGSISLSPGFEIFKNSDRATLNSIRSGPIAWLQNNLSQASSDSAFGDKWYNEAKSAESQEMAMPQWTFVNALGTIDIILQKTTLNDLTAAGQSFSVPTISKVVSKGVPDAISAASDAAGAVAGAAGNVVGSILKNIPIWVWVGGAALIAIIAIGTLKPGVSGLQAVAA